MIALQVKHLGHSFGQRRALESVSFSIHGGVFAVLLGPNGAGKTTLFSLVTGLYHPRQGNVRVFGHDMRRNPTAGLAETGIVFQQPTLDLDLTVAENLRYHASLHGLHKTAAETRADEELERLGIRERRLERVRALSGGLRRRVEIARALLHRPRLLLMDEPTTGLDIASRTALLEYARALCRDSGIAVLWATHLLEEVSPTDQLVVLHRGRVHWSGVAAAISPAAGLNGLPAAFAALTEAA
jgi:ABC-2 type transport system ATP-binding protein